MPSPFDLDVVHESGDWAAFGDVEAAVRAAAAALARHPAVHLEAVGACVALASDDAVQRLNRDYRGHDTPTNVLSFPAARSRAAASGTKTYIGDVVLAQETVLAEAIEAHIEPRHHLQHLVVHGLLHLLGHDHENDAEAAHMERLETEVLAGLGLADPYARP